MQMKLFEEESLPLQIEKKKSVEVTISCIKCDEQAHIKVDDRVFCMKHYEDYFHQKEGVLIFEFL